MIISNADYEGKNSANVFVPLKKQIYRYIVMNTLHQLSSLQKNTNKCQLLCIELQIEQCSPTVIFLNILRIVYFVLKGIPELGMPPADPLYIPEIDLFNGEKGGIKAKASEINITGLKDFKLQFIR